jgi:hypothetical protein
MPRPSHLVALSLALAIAIALTGCHSPGGKGMSATGDSITWYSTEVRPVTIELVDLRNDQIIFQMDVPPGRQLTVDFVPDEGDDPSLTPDLMRYRVWDIGETMGRLTSALTVPTATSRRIDVYYRDGAEYAEAPPERELRTDELIDRPDWWTPEGGELPANERGLTNYDG